MSEATRDEIVHRAVVNLCQELDKSFPGQNKGGVTDRLAFEVEETIMRNLPPVVEVER